MSQLFSLDAQRCGATCFARAELDGAGITVHTDEGLFRAGSAHDAIRIARDRIGRFLGPAERRGIPWGLLVSVSGGRARYGEWPALRGARPSAQFENSPLARIHRRWHDSGPLSALDNAVQIIRAYAPGRRAAA